MRLMPFGFGGFFGWLLLGLEPFGVECAGFINALVCVRAEEVALGLQQIGRKTRRSVTVEVSQGSRECWRSYAMFDRRR